MKHPKRYTYSPYPVFMISIWILICTFSILSIRDVLGRRDLYLNAAILESKSQAQFLAENTSGLLYSIDLTLAAITGQILHKETDYHEAPPDIRPDILTAIAFLPRLSNLVVTDENQQIRFELFPRGPQLKTDCFEKHRDSWIEFCLESPELKNGKHLIILSRRMENRDGQFKGTVSAGIDPSFFHEKYENYLNPDARSVLLLNSGNQTITRWDRQTGEDKHMDDPVISKLPAESMSQGGIKVHQTPALLITLYQLPNFPFRIAVIHEKTSILARWQTQKNRLFIILGTAFFLGIFAQLTAFSATARRKKAEAELARHHQRLEDTINARTRSLAETNDALQLKIDEQAKTEKQLRESRGQYREIYNSISDCLIILDIKGKVLDVNPAACRTFGYSRDEFIGCHVARIIHKNSHKALNNHTEKLKETGNFSGELAAVRKDGSELSIVARGTVFMFQDRQNVLSVIRDVTKERKNQAQREKLILDLQKALEEIKTLKGIVPICSHCKKIRDDKGYWNLLETYIEKHSEASFSHGLCPECSDSLYGKQDWYIHMKEKKEKKEKENQTAPPSGVPKQ